MCVCCGMLVCILWSVCIIVACDRVVRWHTSWFRQEVPNFVARRLWNNYWELGSQNFSFVTVITPVGCRWIVQREILCMRKGVIVFLSQKNGVLFDNVVILLKIEKKFGRSIVRLPRPCIFQNCTSFMRKPSFPHFVFCFLLIDWKCMINPQTGLILVFRCRSPNLGCVC